MILSLKKTLALGLVVALLAGIAVYAYRLSLPQTGPRVTITSPPLEFSMELDKTEFQLGENITVRFYLKNIGNETITISKANTYFSDDMFRDFDFSVKDSNGTEVYKWSHRASVPVLRQFNITAGEQVSQVYVWRQEDYKPPEWQPLHVPAGTYTIRGIFSDFWLNETGLPLETIETPSITFEIK